MKRFALACAIAGAAAAGMALAPVLPAQANTAHSATVSTAAVASSTLADFPLMSASQQDSLFPSLQGVEPPDTQIAVGPADVVEAVNDTLSVWSKSGSLLKDSNLNAFFNIPAGFAGWSNPRVLYDAASGRWFLSSFATDNSNDSYAYLAVSETSDPAGAWYTYTVADDSTTGIFTDQPMIGVCDDKVVMSWNDQVMAGTTRVFMDAQTVVMQKSSLLTGSLSAYFVPPNYGEYRLVPAQSLSPTATCWMTVNRAESFFPGGSSTSPTLGVIAVTGTPAANNVTLTETDVPIRVTGYAPDPRQPSGSTNDNQPDDRMLGAVWQNNVLWTSATVACTPTGDTTTRSCLRLIEVSTSGTPSRMQDLDLSTKGLDEYYPAVSLDTAGDLFVAYSASSSSLDPGAYAVISPATSIGTFSAPITIAAGQAAYTGVRWGNYSAAAPDPSTPGAVWVAAQYATSDGAAPNWGTAAAEVALASSPGVPQATVAVEGLDGGLWVQNPAATGWQSLGGQIIAPPAAVALPGSGGASPEPVFIATGTDKHLFIRSLTAGWQQVAAAMCIGGPGAVINGSTLTVACRGTDNALWYTTTTVPSSGLPTLGGPWMSLGGVLSAGPAVAPVGTTTTFFVRGSNGTVFTRTPTTGYSQTSWSCIGSPAAAQQATAGVTTFACQGTDHALWQATNTGAGWGPAASLGGTLIGGPAVIATSSSTEFFVPGTDHSVWVRSTSSGWTSIGGYAVGGVAAAGLS